ncbi:MAG: hypothetical protein RIT45_2824 [Pseudomonadota bacterium]
MSRQVWFVALMTLVVLAGGCGEVTIADGTEDGASASDGSGGGGDDAVADSSGGDTSGGDTGGGDTGGGDTSGGDTSGGDATADADPGFVPAGQGEMGFEAKPGPANFAKVVLRMFQTKQPPIGKVFVFWLVQADDGRKFGGVLPYEDIPYKADFTLEVPSTLAGDDPLPSTVGGEITLEDEIGAGKLTAPTGQVLYTGKLPAPAWVHVVHSLAAKPEGGKGYLQDADSIVANVDGHREAAKAAFVAGKPKDAVKEAEAAHNALVGKSAAVDLDGDGFKTFDAPFAGGLKAPETSLHHAVKHIGFAQAAAPELGKDANLNLGAAALSNAAGNFDKGLPTALDALEAFADGTNKDFKDADTAMQALRKSMNDALAAGRKIAAIPLLP